MYVYWSFGDKVSLFFFLFFGLVGVFVYVIMVLGYLFSFYGIWY